MIYAITGCSGFIGQALKRYLIAKGHVVIPVKRHMFSNVESLATFLRDTRADKIFHLAAYGNHYHQTDDKETLRVNVLYSLNLFKAAAGVPVVNVSTSSVTLKQQTVYSVSKFAAEQLAKLFPNVVTVRPYSVYGPGEAAHRFIPTIIRCLKTGEKMPLDGAATHDWVYVDDFITGLLNGHTEIGSGEKITNFEIVTVLEKISGRKLNFELARLRNYDNEDWVCADGVKHRSIEEGLLQCWQYYSK